VFTPDPGTDDHSQLDMLSVIGTQQLSDDSLPEARGPARQ